MQKPTASDRILRLKRRMEDIDRQHRRTIFAGSTDIALGMAATRPPKPGTTAGYRSADAVLLGDQSSVVRVDAPFPGTLPSQVEGLLFSPVQLARDYEALLDASPVEIHEDESIVGEYHWELPDLRPRVFPDSEHLDRMADRAEMLGAGGYPVTHTCADLEIGLQQGWSSIGARIEDSLGRLRQQGRPAECTWLEAARIVCAAIMRFIARHGDQADRLALTEPDPHRKRRLQHVADTCAWIAAAPPRSFREAVQWVWFYIMVERMELGGNGYGRIDQYLLPFYRADMRGGRTTREEAREIVAELFLKFPTFYSLGGRNEAGADATNELSWLFLEAYDMIGGTNEFGVLWHADIDPLFFQYACEVLVRHGTGSPTLVNQDVLRASEIRSGVPESHATNVAYSGCFWYCIPGREWCAHDTVAINGLKCFLNALAVAFEHGVRDLEDLLRLFEQKLEQAIRAMQELTDWQLRRIPTVYPEIVTSLMSHGCIERGKDITDCGTDNNSIVVQFAGLANIADALVALKRRVFDEHAISLETLQQALRKDFEGYEAERQLLLSCPKYGNDDDEADGMAVLIAEHYRQLFSRCRTCKGTAYRPAFFSWAGHAYAEKQLGASPDGRHRADPMAQGANPMHGRNRKGITATARSLSKLDFPRNAGGPMQLEIDPSLRNLPEPGRYLAAVASGYFRLDGAHIIANVVSREELEDAIVHPEHHEDLVVRVTGFSVHFVQLDRTIQEEIVQRTRHRVPA